MENKKLDQWIKIGIGVLLVGLAWVIISTLQEPVIVEGVQAPKFAVRSDNGTLLTPTDFGGKLLLLNFWASWCAPCVEEEPSLNQLSQRFKPAGLVVLGISVDHKEAAYRDFIKRLGVDFHTYRDPEQDLSFRYGSYKFPESYLIDRSGKVVLKIVGAPERGWMDPDLVSSIQRLL
jgi:cytochrome c biogenesis protein CcmG, thiol:disulfide interchange protein DsbE